MKTILKIVVGIVVAAIVLVAGLAALLDSAVDEVQKDSDQHSITEQQFKQIKKGSTIKQVKSDLGEPDDQQVTEVDGLEKQTCIYYNKEGELASMYQFCFDGKRLSSKSSY